MRPRRIDETISLQAGSRFFIKRPVVAPVDDGPRLRGRTRQFWAGSRSRPRRISASNRNIGHASAMELAEPIKATLTLPDILSVSAEPSPGLLCRPSSQPSTSTKRSDMTHIFRRVPKIALATLAGTLAIATLSGPGLTTTTAYATGACTDTITGAHSGTLTLSGPGTTCLKNATQDGAITVSNGHELSVADSKIYGAVTSTSSAPFTFCHSSTVRGAINVASSMNFVLIGDNGL